ncbi:MAG: hypothetical protein H7331_06240 [Bacteroidia bacterium]|nr:hypothetical protein [Bacteroidia bacterium]
MKKYICSLTIYLTLFGNSIFAQNVGINTTNPDPSAVLDVSAFDKGILIPQVALSSTNLPNPVTAPAVSLLVYNTVFAGISPNEVTPGYYYWDGLKWASLKGSAWQLSGNAGTNSTTNFIGTTDAQDLVIRTNSIEKLRVLSAGNVGVATALPTSTLDVNGTLRVRNVPLIVGAENTLTIDATGNVHQKAGVTYVGTVYGGDFGSGPNPAPITGYFTSASANSFGCVFGVCWKDEVQVNFPSLSNTNYVVSIVPVCETGGLSCGDNNITPATIYDRTPTSFKWVQAGTVGVTQDITWHIMITTY